MYNSDIDRYNFLKEVSRLKNDINSININEFYNIKFPDRDSLIKEIDRLKHENYNLKKEYRKLECSKGLYDRTAYIVMYGDTYSNIVFTDKDRLQEFVKFENDNDDCDKYTWYKELFLMDSI